MCARLARTPPEMPGRPVDLGPAMKELADKTGAAPDPAAGGAPGPAAGGDGILASGKQLPLVPAADLADTFDTMPAAAGRILDASRLQVIGILERAWPRIWKRLRADLLAQVEAENESGDEPKAFKFPLALRVQLEPAGKEWKIGTRITFGHRRKADSDTVRVKVED